MRAWLGRIGDVKVVSLNYSQYSNRYDAFRQGAVLPSFDPAKSGGVLMDLGLYSLHYALGLFGAPESVSYAATVERGIDTSGIATPDYGGFKVASAATKDCTAPAQNVIEGTDGYILQTTPANECGRVALHLNDGTEESYDENPELRWESELRSFAVDVAAGAEGLARCYEMFDESLLVACVQMEARLAVDIRFPADDAE